MIKLYSLVALALAISINLHAQCTDVTFTHQSDINAFPYTGCTTISGSLTISGNDIYDLEGLSNLTSVGQLVIKNTTSLYDLSGLGGVTAITGSYNESIWIAGNAGLANIDKLNNITSVSGSIIIQNNDNLVDIDGLTSLTTVSGRAANIYINGNYSLDNLDGLHSLSTFSAGDIGGIISIAYNPSLRNIDGLSSLTTIDGGGFGIMEVLHNPMLINLNGLKNLSSITTDSPSIHPELKIKDNTTLQNGCGAYALLTNGDTTMIVTISNNANVTKNSIMAGGSCDSQGCHGNVVLTSQAEVDAFPVAHGCTALFGSLTISGSDIRNVDALIGLDSIVGFLEIVNNPKLTSLEGLKKVFRIWDHVTVSNNALLKNVDGLRGLQEVYSNTNASLTISNNASLTNLDGFYNLEYLQGDGHTLTVTDNPSLVSTCGIYYAVRDQNWCDHSGNVNCELLIFSNNATEMSWNSIIENSYCVVGPDDPTPPSNLTFTDVTENSLTLSFTRGKNPNYLIVVRAGQHGDPPQNSNSYNVGDLLGCCTIVVGTGPDSVHYIVDLEPDTEYYFDVYPNLNNFLYYWAPLSGQQRTLPAYAVAYPNPFVDELTIPVTVQEENSTVTVMIADQMGRPVSQMTKTLDAAGRHEIKWDRMDHTGNRAQNGIYMYSVKTPNQSFQGMIVAK